VGVLCLKRKKRKHCVRSGSLRVPLTAANQEWALDFAHDVVAAGRTIRVLSVVDAFTRECLALEVDTGFASRRVTHVLDEVIARRGIPQAIRCDNGPELTSPHFLAWGLEWKIELRHIQPGKPTQNAHVESFHGRLREECLRPTGSATCSTHAPRSPIGERSTTKLTPQQPRLQNTQRIRPSPERWRDEKRLRRFPPRHRSIKQLKS
jgi:transposase InsO family protein